MREEAMTAPREKMICAKCRKAMNWHAEKLIYSLRQGEAAGADAALGGFIEEMHTCPGCGKTASRAAA